MGVVQNAVNWAVAIANDASHGYDQTNRWGPDYDCSSFVISAFKQAGVPLTCTYTGDMLSNMLANNFSSISLTAGIQYGDVLLNVSKGHTAIYIGNNQLVQASISENGTVHAGQVGDQTGAEIAVRSYYNYPWEYILRYNENENVPESGALGIDTAFSNVINPSTVSLIEFGIPRIGTFGYGQTGTTAYYNKALNVDAGFLSSVNNLLSAGKYAGCYIFSYAWDTTAAVAEADRVCDYLDANNVNLNLPVFFDWERAGTYGSYEMVTAAGITVTAQLVRNMTLAFMQRVVSRGRRAGWYQGSADLAAWFTTDIVQQYRNNGFYLWYAKWQSNFDNYPCDCWQYAGDTSFNGVACDLNKSITSRFFGGGVTPGPGPEPGETSIPLWLLFKISQNNTLKRR